MSQILHNILLFFLALLQYLLTLIIFDFKFEIDNFIYIIIFVIFVLLVEII